MSGYDPEAYMRRTGVLPPVMVDAQPLQRRVDATAASDGEQPPLVCKVHVRGVPPESISLGIQTDGSFSDGQKIVIKLGFIEGDACEGSAYEGVNYEGIAYEGSAYEGKAYEGVNCEGAVYEDSPHLNAPLTFASENVGLDPDFSTHISEDFDPAPRVGLPSFEENYGESELAPFSAVQMDSSQMNYSHADNSQADSSQADGVQGDCPQADSSPADCLQADNSQGGHSQDSAQPTEKKKSRVGDVLFYLFLVALVVGAFVLFGGSGNGPRTFAGYGAFTVTTGSMHDVLPQGSLIVTKQVDPETLQIGDDITYMTSETTSITHRIVGIEEEYESTGERAFKTKGTMNKSPDAKLVPAVNVVGKVVFCSPALGAVVGFVQGNWPLLIFLAIVAGGLAVVLRRILR